MLINHTFKDYTITSRHAGKRDLITVLRRDLHQRTFDKIVRTIDDIINKEANKPNGKLVWMCTGSLVGHGSRAPHYNIEHLWEHIISVVGDGRLCRMTMGALVQWRIAYRAETMEENWHCIKREKDEYDPETGEQITWYEYWRS